MPIVRGPLMRKVATPVPSSGPRIGAPGRKCSRRRVNAVPRRKRGGAQEGTMRASIVGLVTVVCLSLQACATGPPASPADQRAAIRQMASDTLAQLYQSNPGTQAAIQAAAGYAVFSDIGMKMFYGGA